MSKALCSLLHVFIAIHSRKTLFLTCWSGHLKTYRSFFWETFISQGGPGLSWVLGTVSAGCLQLRTDGNNTPFATCHTNRQGKRFEAERTVK